MDVSTDPFVAQVAPAGLRPVRESDPAVGDTVARVEAELSAVHQTLGAVVDRLDVVTERLPEPAPAPAAEPAAEPVAAAPTRVQQGVCELLGTLALIYVGVMVLVAGGPALFGDGTKDLLAVALAHGLTIAVMVSATMAISGGQLNPAVSVGLLLARKLDRQQATINIACQVAGGVAGGLLARASLGGIDISGGIPALGSGVSVGQGILVEAVLTFFLVFVVFGTGVDGRFGAKLGGLAIGLTVCLDILAGGPVTGAAMNTARWIGPAVANGTFPSPPVYLAGPLLGACAAALVWSRLLLPKRP